MLPCDIKWVKNSSDVPDDVIEKISELCSRLFFDGHILNEYILNLLFNKKSNYVWIIFNVPSPFRSLDNAQAEVNLIYISELMKKFNPSLVVRYDTKGFIELSYSTLLATEFNNNNTDVIINDSSVPLHDRRIILVLQDESKKMQLVNQPQYTIEKALQLFKFPPNHPIANTAYAMADVFPDHYIPISQFHQYFKETKHAAFIELCASLGAKEITIERAEINNQALDINGDIKTPLSQLGLGINVKENRETGEKIAFKFSEENKGIKDYDSPWINTEASWRSMIKLRRDNHMSEVGAEFNCVDDMGINTGLTAQLQGVGVNIGGSFQEMTKIRLSYNVLFW